MNAKDIAKNLRESNPIHPQACPRPFEDQIAAMAAQIRANITGDIGKLRYKLIDSMKQLSKPLKQMITELIDNSIDAGATKITITLLKDSNGSVCEVIVADNGSGMNYQTLLNSYTMGEDRENLGNEMGKFRLGGTLYCLDHFRKKQTLTKMKGTEAPIKRFSDLDIIKERDEWVTFPEEDLSDEDLRLWAKYSPNNDTGTVIKLTSPGKRTTSLKHCLKEVKNLCGVKYHNHIVIRGLEITVNNTLIKPMCPILSNNKLVSVSTTDISDNTGNIICKVHCADLTKLSRSSDGSLTTRSGIYAMRNGAVLTDKPFWFGDSGMPPLMTSKRQNDSKGRYLIEFTDEVDDVMGISNGKDALSMSQSIADKISAVIHPEASRIRKLASHQQSSSDKKIQEAVAENTVAFSKKSLVEPKKTAVQKKKTGRKNTMSGDYAGSPKKKANSWLTGVNVDAYGHLTPLTFIKEGALCINTELPFYTKILKNSSKESMEAFQVQAVSYHAALTETRDIIETEQCEEKQSYAREMLRDFEARLDKKLRQV